MKGERKYNLLSVACCLDHVAYCMRLSFLETCSIFSSILRCVSGSAPTVFTFGVIMLLPLLAVN